MGAPIFERLLLRVSAVLQRVFDGAGPYDTKDHGTAAKSTDRLSSEERKRPAAKNTEAEKLVHAGRCRSRPLAPLRLLLHSSKYSGNQNTSERETQERGFFASHKPTRSW